MYLIGSRAVSYLYRKSDNSDWNIIARKDEIIKFIDVNFYDINKVTKKNKYYEIIIDVDEIIFETIECDYSNILIDNYMKTYCRNKTTINLYGFDIEIIDFNLSFILLKS